MTTNSLPLPANEPARSIFASAYRYQVGLVRWWVGLAKTTSEPHLRASRLCIARKAAAEIRRLRRDV